MAIHLMRPKEIVAVRVYGSLADFVGEDRRGVAFACELGERRSVKDLIESLGVPHCEVLLVLVDGVSVGFEHVLSGGERIAVYPHFGEIDTSGLATAGEPLPAAPAFVLDGHLGRLAAYLRALGIDTAHDRDADDEAIARRAADEGRVVLTRDIGLLKRSNVRHGHFVRSTVPREQLDEVVRRFRLADRVAPFTRCLRCNSRLVAISPAEARATVPPAIHARFAEFSRCPACHRTYWPGTHHEKLARALAPLVKRTDRAQ